jgi:hypothetical protein
MNEEKEECSVYGCKPLAQVLPCKHSFCTSCTSRIIGKKLTITCPLCRGEFVVPKKTAVE